MVHELSLCGQFRHAPDLICAPASLPRVKPSPRSRKRSRLFPAVHHCSHAHIKDSFDEAKKWTVVNVAPSSCTNELTRRGLWTLIIMCWLTKPKVHRLSETDTIHYFHEQITQYEQAVFFFRQIIYSANSSKTSREAGANPKQGTSWANHQN